MTELIPFSGEEDEFLRRALLLANTPEVMGLQEGEPVFSPRFERRMARLMADPFRRAKKELRPLWAKALNTAAMLALVATVALATLWASPTARAWLERVVKDVTGYSVDFTFRGTNDGDVGTWTPEYLPKGFELVETSELNGTKEIRYQNSQENEIEFSYRLIRQGNRLSFDTEHSDYEQITLNGHPADLFRSNTPGFPSFLMWTGRGDEIAFYLVSDIDPDELIQIAKSITASN